MQVSITNLNKHIAEQHVLKNINLTIPQGQIVGLLGPNGAGKSTLMKILTGVWDADKGSQITVPERIGYLPELNPLYGEMYVREYLQTIGRLTINNAQCTVHDAQGEVEELIDRVGLRPEARKRIRELSKGYKQRVGLAQAMMGNPELLILDEPTTGLDPNQLIEIRQLIKRLTVDNARCTVILSTHILQEVREMCDRVIILHQGQIQADRPMNEITDLEQLFSDGTRV
ncbi:MAG: ABC transporter ATP-binding protein [Paludibacteraceae bacterium]|nr:ABC transporter ATP-binding protein [Paludibacteraceae bacterium]